MRAAIRSAGKRIFIVATDQDGRWLLSQLKHNGSRNQTARAVPLEFAVVRRCR